MAPRTPSIIFALFFPTNFLMGSIEKKEREKKKKYSHWSNHGEKKEKKKNEVVKKMKKSMKSKKDAKKLVVIKINPERESVGCLPLS